mmetsp:Transcript_26232/g.52289  ORF Transcript_26232/g.52289 Transcript_26232/m.52289 type:complete len:306 (-) Transcript_26232:104-1021(-)
MKFFTLAYTVGTILVPGVNCGGPPALTKPYEQKSKFPVGRSANYTSLDSTNKLPPYGGTVWISKMVLTKNDPNASNKRAKYGGKKCRQIYHQHLSKWIRLKNTFLFRMTFNDGIKFWVWVDPKYKSVRRAKKVITKMIPILGTLPEFLRRDIHVIAILKKGEGANADVLGGVITLHEKSFEMAEGYNEEVCLHEGAHTSVDDNLYNTAGWNRAVKADNKYISDYASDYSNGEDVAESFGAWFALKSGRLKNSDNKKITSAIPNRLALFDNLYSYDDADWFPISGKKSGRQYKTPTIRDYGDWYHC